MEIFRRRGSLMRLPEHRREVHVDAFVADQPAAQTGAFANLKLAPVRNSANPSGSMASMAANNSVNHCADTPRSSGWRLRTRPGYRDARGAAPLSSACSASRNSMRVRLNSLETCICDTPSRAAMSDWIMFLQNLQ